MTPLLAMPFVISTSARFRFTWLSLADGTHGNVWTGKSLSGNATQTGSESSRRSLASHARLMVYSSRGGATPTASARRPRARPPPPTLLDAEGSDSNTPTRVPNSSS